MKSFKQLEAEFKKTHIKLIDGSATGVLSLDGEQTEALLSCSSPLAFDNNSNGWFDFRAKTADGAEVVLHNTIYRSRSSHHWEAGTAYSEAVFPNILIADAQHVSDVCSIRRIQFDLEGLIRFFPYTFIEWQSLYDVPAETLRTLKDLRSRNPYGDNEEFFNPKELHLVHSFPRFFKLAVGDRCYEAFSRSSFLPLSRAKLLRQTWVIAAINFNAPVSIDAALDAMWEWRYFFESIALANMQPVMIAVSSSIKPRDPSASIYLPNQSKAETDHDFSADDLPWIKWGDRQYFSRSMQRWLSRSEERQLFRTSVGRVISRMFDRTSIEDVVTLCSAVESLKELAMDEGTALRRKDRQKLASAAIEASQVHNINISAERIQGLFGNLGSASLSKRFDLMASKLRPILPAEDLAPIFRSAVKFRQIGAHGKATSEMAFGGLSSTVRGLAAACVLYDCISCGVDGVSRADRPLREIREALRDFERLANGSI